MNKYQRQIDHLEYELLDSAIRHLEKGIYGKLNWKLIVFLILLTILTAIHIYYYDKSNWSLISKFLVVTCPIVIWVLVESKYKGRRKGIKELNELKKQLNGKPINVFKVLAQRVIEFEENDDEGRLYLIETIEGKCIYLWDEQHLIPEYSSFPCTEFEIYLDDTFKYALERKVKCIGQKLDPIRVSEKEKWEYFKVRGFPGDLEVEIKTLDKVTEEIKKLLIT